MTRKPLPEHQHYLRDTFGRDGLFAKAFPGYERREGQLRLTVAIHNAFREGYNLLAEGPCGTGKSMAYLVPAIEHARPGEAVVVATANIALQEQLFYKDLPLLAKVLGRDIKYGLVKGKNNYLCQTRFAEWKEEQVGLYGSNDEETEAVIEWGSSTETGDITELGRLLDAEPDWRTWSRICGDGDECKSCKDYECFAYTARAKAADSQVLICNYHVLFAHLELQAATGGQAGLLPPLKYVICDEAHEMPDIARDFAQVSVSERGVRGLCTEALGREDPELRARLERAVDDFFGEVRDYAESGAYKFLLKDPSFADGEPLIAALEEHNALWEEKLDQTQGGDAKSKGFKRTLRRRIRRGTTAIKHLLDVTSLENENYVYWIEGHRDEWERKRGAAEERPIKINGKPKSVADYLDETLFSKTTSTIITSATLTTNGRFSWVKKELGIKAKVLAVESPFDFETQALLVVPQMRHRPNDKEFIDEVTEELIDLLRETDGRALGLFTSYKNMRAVAEGLRCEDMPFTILMQGEKPKAALLEEFLSDTHSVLLGTKSFWQGVDVKGEALTLLFIDKIPFPPPSDPVIAAMDEDPNENAFWDHSVPRATIALRQGFGRLIRSQDDVGVCVIFDNRLLKSRYGDKILNSLPSRRPETRVQRVLRFLEKHGLVRDDPPELEEQREFAGTPLDIPDDEVPF